MKIKDRVYGEFEITEKVLINLINCKSMQRLKNISQMGMPDKYYHKKGFSRFEHSVGVMLLLRKLGASLEEQIAGLLHDVSHTAFSHVIDWVIGDSTKESHQDDLFIKFIEESEIPDILKIHGFDYKLISDLDKFSLLENDAPNICADRVDYSLREIIEFESSEKFKVILNGIIAHKGTIMFNSIDSAEVFSLNYAICQKEHWAGNEAKARYHILAKTLKRALDNDIISLSDFLKTDNEVIDILQKSKDNKIIEGLNLLKDGFTIRLSNGSGAVILQKTFRYVDPFVLNKGLPSLLSSLSKVYEKSLGKQRAESISKDYVEVFPR